tara:strand:- start:245 stop:1027 length:783 start_codon:yes stop_codon:yes gene_type:complete
MNVKKTQTHHKYLEFFDRGYQIFDNVLSVSDTLEYKKNLHKVYQKQVSSFGLKNLETIHEENMIRSPFLYDEGFQHIFYNDFTREVVRDILGEHAILSLQNAIVIPPQTSHHQGFYHRDIIYQEFVASIPLAINIYYCLDDYGETNGGTTFIPGSHRHERFDETMEAVTPCVKAGSAILFDSMVFHQAGTNSSNLSRCGINNMYTLPFMKQQIDYPSALPMKPADLGLSRLLGYESQEHPTVDAFRQYRLHRQNNRKNEE